jgi:hypothetical protein
MSDAKPKMMFAIEHIDSSITHLNSAMEVLSSVIMDLQKGADFLTKYRNSLIKTVEDTGGNVTQAIESQIRDFIPKRMRDGKDQETQDDRS